MRGTEDNGEGGVPGAWGRRGRPPLPGQEEEAAQGRAFTGRREAGRRRVWGREQQEQRLRGGKVSKGKEIVLKS